MVRASRDSIVVQVFNLQVFNLVGSWICDRHTAYWKTRAPQTHTLKPHKPLTLSHSLPHILSHSHSYPHPRPHPHPYPHVYTDEHTLSSLFLSLTSLITHSQHSFTHLSICLVGAEHTPARMILRFQDDDLLSCRDESACRSLCFIGHGGSVRQPLATHRPRYGHQVWLPSRRRGPICQKRAWHGIGEDDFLPARRCRCPL